jgi:hypothetical protein
MGERTIKTSAKSAQRNERQGFGRITAEVHELREREREKRVRS